MTNADRAQQIKDRRIPRKLFVKSAENITPNMRRVTLFGDDLAGFPEDSEGAYIKLLFDDPIHDAKRILRTYTVSKQRPAKNEVDIDFMLHVNDGHTGLGIAAPWAVSAQPGDEILISGPGPAKFINTDATFFLLASDMTGLPALIANLKRLPENAKGKVFIEIFSEADKQPLVSLDNVDVTWVVNNNPGSDESPLHHAIEQAKWCAGKKEKFNNLSAWVACEFKTMKKIRHFLKVEREIKSSHLYISSYWKRGDNEEAHKIVKRVDSEKN